MFIVTNKCDKILYMLISYYLFIKMHLVLILMTFFKEQQIYSFIIRPPRTVNRILNVSVFGQHGVLYTTAEQLLKMLFMIDISHLGFTLLNNAVDPENAPLL